MTLEQFRATRHPAARNCHFYHDLKYVIHENSRTDFWFILPPADTYHSSDSRTELEEHLYDLVKHELLPETI